LCGISSKMKSFIIVLMSHTHVGCKIEAPFQSLLGRRQILPQRELGGVIYFIQWIILWAHQRCSPGSVYLTDCLIEAASTKVMAIIPLTMRILGKYKCIGWVILEAYHTKFYAPKFHTKVSLSTPQMEHYLKLHAEYSCLKCTLTIHESLWLLLRIRVFSTLKIYSLFIWCPKNVF